LFRLDCEERREEVGLEGVGEIGMGAVCGWNGPYSTGVSV